MPWLENPEDTIKVDIPDEPGQWVRYRVLTGGMVEKLTDRSTSNMAAAAVVEWSYPGPPTAENIRDHIDSSTFFWLVKTINDASGLRSDPESEGSEPPSLPISEPAKGNSHKSSAT